MSMVMMTKEREESMTKHMLKFEICISGSRGGDEKGERGLGGTINTIVVLYAKFSTVCRMLIQCHHITKCLLL